MTLPRKIPTLFIALVPAVLLFTAAIETSWALKCYCNECGDHTDTCETSDHRDSRCFKSVAKEKVNKTYVDNIRFGCFSGSDTHLGSLQCQSGGLGHTELTYIACCNNCDECNYDLPDPNVRDDPRWNMTEPPQNGTNQDIDPSTVRLIVISTIIITILAVCLCLCLYKLTAIIFNHCCGRKKFYNDSQDSVCSFKVNFDEQLKSQFLNHHLNQHSNSSTASTHTYSVSDFLPHKPDSPQENTCASIENSSTLPDLTSGVGGRVLELRTMARVVDSGATVPVGSGRFGRVFKGTYHCEDVAVKAFRAVDCEVWRREEKILKQLNHENIVRFIASETYTVGVCEIITETWMFLEFCPYGSLCDFLDQYEICEPQQAIKILYSIIKGLSYLHEEYSYGYKPSIAHRDIKSRNILMKTPETCCIADFGHAVVKIDENTMDFGDHKRIQVGTVRYMAPEILKPSPNLDTSSFHTFAQADLYQFGLVLWEVCYRTALDISYPTTHRLPYDGVVPQNPHLEDMIKIVCEDNYRPPSLPYWEKYPIMQLLADLMVECWRPNPKGRVETLGVKKKLKELYDRLIPEQTTFYNNNLINNFSETPNLKTFSEKSGSLDKSR